jgi:plastocyanin
MIGITPNGYRVLAAVAAMAVAGLICPTGISSAAAGPGGREEPAAVIVISDAPGEFMPRTTTVRVGDTVEWKNTGGIAHSVEFVGEVLPEGTASSQSGLMAPQKSYSFTFKAPGSYPYICRFHVINGMIGKIVVIPDLPASATPVGTR